MRQRRVFVALLCVLTSAVAAPQAAAAEACQVEDLPVPAGAFEARTRGTSDNGLIVGEVQHNGVRGVVWANGQPSEMAAPANPNVTSVRPADINNHGSVVGTQETFGSGETLNRAFIYRDGVYYLLFTEGSEQSKAIGVNDNGDVIGEVWLKSAPQSRWVALWPAGQPRRLYNKGKAIGISADRKLVLATNDTTTWVIDGNTGAWTTMPGARTPMTFDNERILHFEFTPAGTQIAEWNLTGQRVEAYAEGRDVYGKNASGVLFGVSTHGQTSVWSGGTRKEIVADKLPHFSYAADITDDGTMIGTYQGEQSGLPHAARWICS